jgi:hypothetical protein
VQDDCSLWSWTGLLGDGKRRATVTHKARGEHSPPEPQCLERLCLLKDMSGSELEIQPNPKSTCRLSFQSSGIPDDAEEIQCKMVAASGLGSTFLPPGKWDARCC